MRPQDIISKKRDGKRLSKNEISFFIDGVTNGSWADYQITALVMAMYINELNSEEQSLITEAMLNSGEVLDFSEIDKPKADKHSTGGVGDKVSLIIAPLAAVCGLAVPMISGRGLGHTGGTLDKLESIKGYNVNLTTKEFRRITKECGFAMAGQTSDLVPADKKLYALRDATATVSTIPLIVASIMSKKLAEGLDALVLDVKTGNGAFMREPDEAKRLARAMVETGNSCGVNTKALITDMSQPLGKYVGNALEVIECVEILRGKICKEAEPTWELSLELTSQMLVSSGISDDIASARDIASSKLWSGEAFEAFCQNVELQGGDTSICENPEILFDPNLIEIKIKADRSGVVSEIDTREIGNSIREIGGGRMKAEDSIDSAVGYSCETKLGEKVRSGDTLGTLLCRDQADANLVGDKLQNGYKIEDAIAQEVKLIIDIVE